MQGHLPERGTAQTGAPQYIREAILLLLAGVLLNFMAKQKREFTGRVTIHPGVVIVGLVVASEVVRTLASGSAPTVVAFGLRTLGLILIYMGLRWFGTGQARAILRDVARYAKPLVLIEFALATYQVRTAPAMFGGTFAGARPWGTLSAPNNFSAMCVSLAVLFLVGKPKRWPLWMLMCLGFAFLSGSRTGSLGVVIVVGMLLIKRVPYKLLLAPIGAVVLYAVITLASSEAISGRSIDGEGRFDGWAKIFSTLNPLDLIFGIGVGLGSNATLSTYGYDNAEAFVADSQLVSFYLSFGIAGVLIIAWATLAMWRNGLPVSRLFYVPVILVLGTVYNIGEYAPANLILVLIAGTYARRAHPELATEPLPVVKAGRLAKAERPALTPKQRSRYFDEYSRGLSSR
ncbi:membrane protein [Arthrobacter phage Zucker]|nr:membrane protein [Arthrobacter phage Zucker]